MKRIIINRWYEVIIVIGLFILFGNQTSAYDVSLEVAKNAQANVENAAGSLKKGFQSFGEKIAEIAPDIYKVKAKIEQYNKAGQWDSIPEGEKALVIAQALESIGRLEQAFGENLEAMVQSMEVYEQAIGDAIVATTTLKGTNQSSAYYFKEQEENIKQKVLQIDSDPAYIEAKKTLNLKKCQDEDTQDPECKQAYKKLIDVQREIQSLTRRSKLLKQKEKLADMRQNEARRIQNELRELGPEASRMFRDVIDVWGELSGLLALLRDLPSGRIVGQGGQSKTTELVTLADNMTKMGNDLVDLMSTVLDSMSGSVGQLGTLQVSGTTYSPQKILEDHEAAKADLLRILNE